MRLKVYHFILDSRTGGPHAYVRGLVSKLAREIDFVVVTSGRGPITDWALTNLHQRLKYLYPLEVVLNVLCIFWHFRRGADRVGVIFNVHGAANLAPIFAARILSIPIVWHFHETLLKFAQLVKLGRKVTKGIAHRYIVVANKSREVFSLKGAKLIPGAVDSAFWYSTKKPLPGNARLKIISIGNLNPLKGFDILLEAIRDFGKPWEMVIVGAELNSQPEYAALLRKLADKAAGPLGSVQFVGWQSPESVRRLLAQSDVFVLPSRSEACPLALLEAMATGCACVATDVGDVSEVLGTPGSGVIIPKESREELLVALNYVESIGLEGRREMGRLARERVVAEYSLENMAVDHLKIYRQLAEQR